MQIESANMCNSLTDGGVSYVEKRLCAHQVVISKDPLKNW